MIASSISIGEFTVAPSKRAISRRNASVAVIAGDVPYKGARLTPPALRLSADNALLMILFFHKKEEILRALFTGFSYSS
jgi:hypothetical protein